jgi:hypothetical protein
MSQGTPLGLDSQPSALGIVENFSLNLKKNPSQ